MILLLAAIAHADPAPRDLPGEVMPDREWDFVHLDLEVKLDLEAGTVDGTATHTVRPLGAPSGWVRLHQVALHVHEVTVDGAPVEGWRLGPDTLDVPVPADATEHTVSVRYTATPHTGVHFRGGRGTSDPIREAWTQGEFEENRYWLPTWDYPNDKYTVATDVIVRDDLVAFANGELQGKEAAGDGWTRWSWRLDRPIVGYLVAIAAGEYASFDDASEVPLTYVVPRTVGEEAARRSLAVTADQMPWMSELLGHPFPYPVYRQVFVSRFLYGGMENATLTVLSDRLLLSHPTARDRGTEEVVAHELAHQWFGDLLTCYGWRELWLNEGFASFYTGRWLEHRYGDDRYAAELRGWMRAALHDPAPMAPRAWSKVEGRDNAAVYVRGASVLHMLRVLLGDATFDAAIRRYVADHADRLVATEDLRRALEDASGQHLGWLFDQWVHGVGSPSVETRWSWTDGAVEVVLHQTTEGAPFSAPVTVEIGLADGARTRRVWLGAGETRLVMELPEAPRWVAVDAPGGVLARWSHEQPVDAWVAQALRSPTAYARLVAIEHLGEGDATRAAVEALRELLRDAGRDREVRRAAARSLGQLGTSDARAALAAALGADDPAVREAVVEALGEAPPDAADVPSLLARQATSDADPYVRAAAVRALAALAPDRAVGIARQRLRRPDPTPVRVEHVAALGILGEHGGADDLDAALRRAGPDAHRDARHAAARAAVALFDGLDDRRREARREAVTAPLLAMLRDRDLRTQQTAIALLGRVGDERAEAALTAWARATTVRSPDLAAAARDAARLIRSRDPAAPAPRGDDLIRLQERLDDLQERLERLETWR